MGDVGGEVNDETDKVSTPLMTRIHQQNAASVASAGEDDAGWTSANNDDDDNISKDPIVEGVLGEKKEEKKDFTI